MTLLDALESDYGGHLYGITENGENILLSVPHSHSVCGMGGKDAALKALERLRQKAGLDSGNYYYINEDPFLENGAFSVAYDIFIK
jgi:hypothetical protein